MRGQPSVPQTQILCHEPIPKQVCRLIASICLFTDFEYSETFHQRLGGAVSGTSIPWPDPALPPLPVQPPSATLPLPAPVSSFIQTAPQGAVLNWDSPTSRSLPHQVPPTVSSATPGTLVEWGDAPSNSSLALPPFSAPQLPSQQIDDAPTGLMEWETPNESVPGPSPTTVATAPSGTLVSWGDPPTNSSLVLPGSSAPPAPIQRIEDAPTGLMDWEALNAGTIGRASARLTTVEDIVDDANPWNDRPISSASLAMPPQGASSIPIQRVNEAPARSLIDWAVDSAPAQLQHPSPISAQVEAAPAGTLVLWDLADPSRRPQDEMQVDEAAPGGGPGSLVSIYAIMCFHMADYVLGCSA